MRPLLLIACCLVPQESLEQRRDRMGARLEEIRGLKFKQPLPIREGGRKEYARTALENARAIYGEDLEAAGKFLKACGFIPSGMNLSVAITGNAAFGVSVYCAKGELVLLDRAAPDDLVLNKMALGLLDQHHPESELRKKIGGNFDAQMALTALRSGDADIAKNLLWVAKKLDERISDEFLPKLIEATDRWEKVDSKFKSAVFPRLFVRSGDFGYRRGAVFVETLRQKGGMESVNRAHEHLPASTEQILHPEKYLADEAPVSLDLSPVEEFLKAQGCVPIYRTTLGEFGTAVFLEANLKSTDFSVASAGWGGDSVILFESGDHPFLVWATEWDSEKDADEFRACLQRVSDQGAPKDPQRTNAVLHRRTSVAWLQSCPATSREGLAETLWKCKKNGSGSYGE